MEIAILGISHKVACLAVKILVIRVLCLPLYYSLVYVGGAHLAYRSPKDLLVNSWTRQRVHIIYHFLHFWRTTLNGNCELAAQDFGRNAMQEEANLGSRPYKLMKVEKQKQRNSECL
jgi:hypothetical protein